VYKKCEVRRWMARPVQATARVLELDGDLLEERRDERPDQGDVTLADVEGDPGLLPTASAANGRCPRNRLNSSARIFLRHVLRRTDGPPSWM
jgi:hypothetical protein